MISSSDILPFFFCLSAALEATSPSTHGLGAGIGSITERVYTCTIEQQRATNKINELVGKSQWQSLQVKHVSSSTAWQLVGCSRWAGCWWCFWCSSTGWPNGSGSKRQLAYTLCVFWSWCHNRRRSFVIVIIINVFDVGRFSAFFPSLVYREKEMYR